MAAPGRLELGAGHVQTGGQVTPHSLLLAQGRRQPVVLTGMGGQFGIQFLLARLQGLDLLFQLPGGQAAQLLLQAR